MYITIPHGQDKLSVRLCMTSPTPGTIQLWSLDEREREKEQLSFISAAACRVFLLTIIVYRSQQVAAHSLLSGKTTPTMLNIPVQVRALKGCGLTFATRLSQTVRGIFWAAYTLCYLSQTRYLRFVLWLTSMLI